MVGLGGIGKSELALQYAHQRRQDYRLVWWIDADSGAQIQAGLAALARTLATRADSVAAAQATAEEAATWALTWLGMHSGWLVIFDNVEEATHVDLYLARLTNGHVLITTRRDIDWHRRGVIPIRLDLLTRQASVQLLTNLIGPSTAPQVHILDKLADQLGDLPLALTQAGAYIARTPCVTAAKYLQLLKDSPDRMHAAAPIDGNAERVVAKVWTLSHTRIHAINPLATHLLNLLACMTPDNLPCAVLNGLEDVDELAVAEALALLASYSLITVTPNPGDASNGGEEDLISIHRLVQAVTFGKLDPERCDSIRDIAIGLVTAALPDEPERVENWPVYRALLPHARTVLPPASPALRNVALFLNRSGDFRTAKSLIQGIYDALDSNLGTEHPDTLTTRHSLAYWTGEAGDPASARDQLTALLPIREHIMGTENPDTLTTRHKLTYWRNQAR